MRAYERLLKYVKVHTTSVPNSGTHPSTLRQFDLAKILVEELKELGLTDAHVDEHCYVYATLPATPGQESAAPLGLIAHMDTADDASGEIVRPQIHDNYDGEAVTLPATGTVNGNSTENMLFLDTPQGQMEIKLDSVNAINGCRVLVTTQRISVPCASGSDAYLHAVTITAKQ